MFFINIMVTLNKNRYETILQYLDYEGYILNPNKRKKNTLNKNKCITDCQVAGRTITHPLNNLRITEYKGPFCATDKWYDEQNHKTEYHDLCNFSESDLLAWADMDTEKFIPLNKIKCEQLLEHFHNIKGIKDAIRWTQQTNHNDSLKNRILSCAWKVYNLTDPDSKIISSQIVDRYHQLSNDNWFDFIYNGVKDMNHATKTEDQFSTNIKGMLSDKKLIGLFITAFRKKMNIDPLRLELYDEDVKIHIMNELKTILNY